MGDEITVSGFSGKEGKLITTDVSYANGKWEGSSLQAGPFKFGVNRDLSITTGVGFAGYEVHINLGLGVGLGQIGTGASRTRANGTTSGGDLIVRPGLGAATVVFAVALAPSIGLAF